MYHIPMPHQKAEHNDLMQNRASLTRFAWLSIGAAVFTIGLKATAYLLTGSVGLLSDAMESVVNLVGAGMALLMLTIAARPADEDHVYGHSKAEYFSSSTEGLLILGAAAAMLSSLLAWFAPSLSWFFPIFILSGFANVSIWTNGMTMATTFGSENERPFYIGLAQTLTAPATIIAPLIGGWVADSFGFVPTFSISAILSVVMMGILIFIVKDPRRNPHSSPLPQGEGITENS